MPANSTIITLSDDLYAYLAQNQSKYQDILLQTIETIAQQQGNSRAITLEDWTTYLQNTLGKESEFFTKFDQFEAFSQGFILEALAEHQSKTASEAETKTPETVDVLSFVKEKVMKKLSDLRKVFSQKFEMLKLLYLNHSFNNKIQSIIDPFSAPNSGASSKMNDQAKDQTQALSALDVVINHGLTELPNDRILVEACQQPIENLLPSGQHPEPPTHVKHVPEHKLAKNQPGPDDLPGTKTIAHYLEQGNTDAEASAGGDSKQSQSPSQ